jgi:cell division topological specificity factor
MGIFSALFGRKPQQGSGDLARERLKVVLVNDRLKLSADVLEQLKQELLAVISRRLEIDEQGVQVIVTHSDRLNKLIADVPIRRPRTRFEDSVIEPVVKPVPAAGPSEVDTGITAPLPIVTIPSSEGTAKPLEVSPSAAPAAHNGQQSTPEAAPPPAKTAAEAPATASGTSDALAPETDVTPPVNTAQPA